jgi:hypothetical protein
VDRNFAPKPPAGPENNGIATAAGKPYFVRFRIDGPEKSVSDKTWTLPDVEKTK